MRVLYYVIQPSHNQQKTPIAEQTPARRKITEGNNFGTGGEGTLRKDGRGCAARFQNPLTYL